MSSLAAANPARAPSLYFALYRTVLRYSTSGLCVTEYLVMADNRPRLIIRSADGHRRDQAALSGAHAISRRRRSRLVGLESFIASAGLMHELALHDYQAATIPLHYSSSSSSKSMLWMTVS